MVHSDGMKKFSPLRKNVNLRNFLSPCESRKTNNENCIRRVTELVPMSANTDVDVKRKKISARLDSVYHFCFMKFYYLNDCSGEILSGLLIWWALNYRGVLQSNYYRLRSSAFNYWIAWNFPSTARDNYQSYLKFIIYAWDKGECWKYSICYFTCLTSQNFC